MSNINYIGYYFTISPLQPASDILIAELGNLGFESFVETKTGVEAYISSNEWHSTILDEVFILKSEEFDIAYQSKEIQQVNWNEEWEKNFNPIIVDHICSVRAPFHSDPQTKYDIIIEPKMSFGTGHHETTHMMIQYLLQTNVIEKHFLDMGCGTGVLAILAAMKKAKTIDAIDIDNWCYLNALENTKKNKCENIKVYEGDVSLLIGKKYDVIFANINRNILLRDIQFYKASLGSGGMLFLSGFYEEDLEMITQECKKYRLMYNNHITKNNWVAASYQLK